MGVSPVVAYGSFRWQADSVQRPEQTVATRLSAAADRRAFRQLGRQDQDPQGIEAILRLAAGFSSEHK
jgi:hypothetical protein